MDQIIERIGTVAKAARQMKGLSQSEVCERAGIHNASLSRLEQGKASKPGIVKVGKVANALGYSMADFFELVEEMSE
jgi:transcriptional regulator with XRE-family HTH domain